ncbi:MAG: hypothetical protein P8020_14200 [Acidobacteriota bacterium]
MNSYAQKGVAGGFTEECNCDSSLTMLSIEYPNLAAPDPGEDNLARWKKFEDEMEAIMPESEMDKITSAIFPKVRDIKGETPMREIRFLP